MAVIEARLMAEFASNRFVNHAGERSARLSRSQSLLEQPQRQTTRYSRTLYKLCFGIPKRHEQQLDGLWIDEISFSVHWRKFIQQMTSEWREQAILVSANLLTVSVEVLMAPYDQGFALAM